MIIDSSTKILGIIGNPIRHSLSPIIHNTWIKNYKLNFAYLVFPIATIENISTKIKDYNISGLNVTLPYKQSVINQIDILDDVAGSIGAINTIKNDAGILSGYNTDIIGIDRSIGDKLNENTSLLILGAGGAAQALAYLANRKNIKTDVFNRTKSKADSLAAKFELSSVSMERVLNQKYNVIVNTTSAGLKQNEVPIELNKFKEKPDFVFDMIYNPRQTKLLYDAAQLNINCINGLSMLINQARESFRIWTGILPD